MGLQIEKHPWNPTAIQLLRERGEHGLEIGKDPFVAACAAVGRHEVVEHVLIDMLAADLARHLAIVLDVHPAQPRLHRLPLGVDLGRGEALHDQIGGVEHEHETGMVDLPVDLGEQVARLADQIGLDLEAEGEVGAVAGLGNLADAVCRLLQIVLGLRPLGRIEGEAADELGLEGMGEFACLGDILGEILFEGHVGILRAVGRIDELDLADRRGDRRHVQAILILEVAEFLDLRQRQLHDVLHALADVDEPQAVILEADGRQRRELLDSREVEGRLISERGKQDAGRRRRRTGHSGRCLVEWMNRERRLCIRRTAKERAGSHSHRQLPPLTRPAAGARPRGATPRSVTKSRPAG